MREIFPAVLQDNHPPVAHHCNVCVSVALAFGVELQGVRHFVVGEKRSVERVVVFNIGFGIRNGLTVAYVVAAFLH